MAVLAKRDCGFALRNLVSSLISEKREGIWIAINLVPVNRDVAEKTYFMKCLFFKLASFLVHGDMMLSLGETYVG